MKDWRRNEPGAFDPATAADRLLDLGIQPGQILPHDSVWPIIGLVRPPDDAPWKEAREMELVRLERFDAVRMFLLEHHCVDLVNVRGEGYRIATPDEQVGLAADDTRRAIQSRLGRGIKRVRHTDTSALSDDQRKQRNDTLARMDRLKSLVRKKPTAAW